MKLGLILAAATFLLAACSSTKSTREESGLPAEVKSLIGAKGRDGEEGLKKAGYEHRNTEKSGGNSITHWQGKGGCLEVTTTDGRYASITAVDSGKCKAGSQETAASGTPGAMRTVCGVIVGGKTTRYLCEVVENRQGTTKLTMPDTNLQLTWKPDGKVEFLQEGVPMVMAKYSESEGETDIMVDERTFFYISNPSAAEMEVKNFKK